MKRFLTFIVLISLNYCILNAQSFEIYNHDSELINGESIIVSTEVDGPNVYYYFSIKNVSSSQKTLKLSMELQTTQIEGSMHFICHPSTSNTTGACGPLWYESTPNIPLNAGETSGDADFIFNQGSNSGVTTILYKVYDVDNESDFVTFTITYSPLTYSPFVSEDQFSVFPNPAVNSFVISNDFGAGAYAEVYNVLGMQINRVDFTEFSEVEIDCSSWEKGYYFCRLYNNGKVEKNIKITVSH